MAEYKTDRSLDVTLTVPTILTATFVLLLCWGLVFIFGVISGRDSASSLIASNTPPVSPSTSTKKNAKGSTSAKGKEAASDTAIIAPTDLGYSKNLKQKGSQPLPPPDAPVAILYPPPQKETASQQKTSTPSEADAQNVMEEDDMIFVRHTDDSDAARYDSTYQLASFRDKDRTHPANLRKKLDRISTRLHSTHIQKSRMLSSP